MIDLGTSFLASVERDPDALAIVDGEMRLSYRDWYGRISALAAALDETGLKRGDHVLTAPLFQDNLLTFVVPYGLALQTLKLTDIHTTLLPREIAVARKIRRKKPWAVATAA